MKKGFVVFDLELRSSGCQKKYVLVNFLEFFFYVLYSTLFHLPPLDSTVSEDAGIEPRTTAALGVGRSNHSAKSQPQT